MAKFIKIIILIIACSALFLTTYDYIKGYYDDFMEEYSGNYSYKGEDVTVVIEKGDSAKAIAKKLKDAGLIDYPLAFTRRLSGSEYSGKLQPGTYTLNTGMSTLQMMAVLSPEIEENEEPIDKLVVPEGFSIELIAARCEKQGICTKKEFINAVNSVTPSDFPFLEDVPAGRDVKYKLQGYLFPATYDIYESTTAESLVEWMLETFEYYYDDDRRAQAELMGYNSFEVVTRASMIEREVKIEKERQLVAGVINNRLEEGMPLQIDPTVLYPLTDGLYDKETMYYDDLELDSPYNTYKYPGLPVGPICNPGIASIDAVLNPAEHNYLYYHVDDEETGEHIFTETYEEHLNSQIIDNPDKEGDDEGEDEDEDNEYDEY